MSAARKKVPGNPRKVSTHGRDIVVGIGKTGLSVARYLTRNRIEARFVDSREEPPGLEELQQICPDAEVSLGEVPANFLKKVDRMIVSPGVADDEPLLQFGRDSGIEVVSDIELFARDAKAPFVAVTGSNGKSTVTTLLSLMCEAAGKVGLAGGNLGEPALDLLDMDTPDFYLLELSSFQLQRTASLPAKVAVLLNISPDHLDWHADEAQYRAAKYRVFDEAESAVINRTDSEVVRHLDESQSSISFALDTPDEGQYGLVTDDGVQFLARGEQLLLATADIALVGAHNQANALAALAAGELIGLELPAMLQVLLEFRGLPHRMQFVARKGAVDYVNDSKATNVGAAIASVHSVSGPVVLIAGGQGKGGDFTELADSIQHKLRAAVLIGEDAAAIAAALDGLAPVHRAGDMWAAVQRAAEIAEPGDTVLLAPACASFDQFESYGQRGEAFCRMVGELPS